MRLYRNTDPLYEKKIFIYTPTRRKTEEIDKSWGIHEDGIPLLVKNSKSHQIKKKRMYVK